MFATLMLLAAAAGPAPVCAHRPAAPTEAVARRLALVMIRNRNRTGQPLPPYDLHIRPDPEDGGQWLAWQSRRVAHGTMRGGGGMSFRIDRCTGRISQITYQR